MTDYCVARTRGDAPWYRGGPCSRKAVRDGYCNTHHPDKVKARRAKAAAEAQARWDAKSAQSPWAVANRYREALRKIADGHNDARAVALQALSDNVGTELIADMVSKGNKIFEGICERGIRALASGRGDASVPAPLSERPVTEQTVKETGQ